MRSTKDFPIRKYSQENFQGTIDVLAVEEPLQINIQYFHNGEKKTNTGIDNHANAGE